MISKILTKKSHDFFQYVAGSGLTEGSAGDTVTKPITSRSSIQYTKFYPGHAA